MVGMPTHKAMRVEIGISTSRRGSQVFRCMDIYVVQESQMVSTRWWPLTKVIVDMSSSYRGLIHESYT